MKLTAAAPQWGMKAIGSRKSEVKTLTQKVTAQLPKRRVRLAVVRAAPAPSRRALAMITPIRVVGTSKAASR